MSDPVVELDSPGQNARVYLELYGGLTGDENVISSDHYIRAVDIDMDIGGYQAALHPYFRVSVYLREHIDGDKLACIFRRQLEPGAGSAALQADIEAKQLEVDAATAPAAKAYLQTELDALLEEARLASWRPIQIHATNSIQRARCLVVRVECIAYSFTPPTDAYLKHFNDQYTKADPPPWGIRITKAVVYGSDLGRNVTTRRVLKDILEVGGMSGGGDAKNYDLTEMYFDGLPKDRWEAIDEVCGMTGDNYAAYGNNVVHFAQPGHGADYSYAYSDPRTTWSIEKTVDEQFGGVRIGFTNAKGKRREVIVHGGAGPRNEYLDAPESIKTGHQATRFGERFLASHGALGPAGSVTIQGVDALGLRPGGTLNGQPITAVTLHPLELSADVQFGENSRRFDVWLARLAAGAKSIKRR